MQSEIEITMETEDQADFYKSKIKEIVSIKVNSLHHLTDDSIKESKVVMQELDEELENCHKTLNVTHEIWRFKSCCVTQLNTAMIRVSNILANNSAHQNLCSLNLVFITAIGLWAISKIL